MEEEKLIYCKYKENTIQIRLFSSFSSNQIRELILKSINIDDDVVAADLVLLSPSPHKTPISQLDFYFVCANSIELPYLLSFSSGINSRSQQQPPQYTDSNQDDQQHQNRDQQIVIKSIHNSNEQETNLNPSSSTSESKSETRTNHPQKQMQKTIPNSTTVPTSSNSTAKPHASLRSVLCDPDQMSPACPDPATVIPSANQLRFVHSQLHTLNYTPDEEVKLSRQLKEFTFNNWEFSDFQLIYLVRKMYDDLDMLEKFKIPRRKFDSWLFDVYCHYNQVAFHNFKHAFMVTQMMYSLIHVGRLKDNFSDLEHLILITSSICHDLHHPGFNNSYQINSRSQLAQLYNDRSPLENHHLSICLALLNPGRNRHVEQSVAITGVELGEEDKTDIFTHLNKDEQNRIRSGLINCILATDMSRHNEILAGFKAINSNKEFNWTQLSHRDLLMMILIKCSDISNEARPLEVASHWIDLLFKEFFQQSDHEKKEGLPVAPFMDRDKVTKAASQCGFIRFVIYPLFDSLATLLPETKDHIVAPVLHQLDYYTRLDNIINPHNKSRRSIIESIGPVARQHRRSSHQVTSLQQAPMIIQRKSTYDKSISLHSNNPPIKENNHLTNHSASKNPLAPEKMVPSTLSPNKLTALPIQISRKFST